MPRPWLHPVLRVSLLACADVAALCVAIGGAYVLWVQSVPSQPWVTLSDLAWLLLLPPAGYAAAGLYPGFGMGAVETLRRLSYCTTAGFLAIGASSLVLRPQAGHWQVAFVLAWLAALALVPLTRFALLSVAVRWEWWREPTLLLGSGPWIEETVVSLQNARSIGFRPVGILTADRGGSAIRGIPVLGEDLSHADSSVRTVMVADRDHLEDLIPILQERFRHVILVHAHRATPAEGVRPFNLGGVLGIEFRNNLSRWRSRVVKRVLDLTLATVLLVPAAPVILVAAIYIRARSAGPVFFVQEREGYNGRPMRLWKLRTMQVDAEEQLQELLNADPAASAEWTRSIKLRRDPRIIPGGALLRRFSLDELPQLWNIVRGELSFVGPRPFPAYHTSQFSPRFRQLRQKVRPGLSGMWQVMARSDGGLDKQELYDSYYIRNWSVWMDLYIMARTVLVVLSGRGAY